MMYISPQLVLDLVPSGVVNRLQIAANTIAPLSDDDTKLYIKNNATWTDVRYYFEGVSSRKCWYTESKNPGCHMDIDHFRPKGEKIENGERVHWYWFEAYSLSNFRLSCHFSNRVTIDWEMQEEGEGGGKGDHFPLCNGNSHATNAAELANEQPVLLDPCRQGDADLIAFLPDGRVVPSPIAKANADTRERVDQSTHLFNLNFPTFNEDREALYNSIRKWVIAGDAAQHIQVTFNVIKERLEQITSRGAAYSMAARCFLRCYRDRQWVDDIVTGWTD